MISIYPHWQGETEIHLLYKKNWQFKFLVAPLIQADCQVFGQWEKRLAGILHLFESKLIFALKFARTKVVSILKGLISKNISSSEAAKRKVKAGPKLRYKESL